MLATRISPAQLALQAAEIREVMRAVLVEGTDYGKIPGVERPSLFKSGAEWLLKWAGFGHRLEPVEIERDDLGRKAGCTYRCTVVLLQEPSVVVSTCDGYAGYDEDRFCQTVEQLEAKERANAAKYRRPARPEKWAQEYRAPYNAVLKMAQKRAMVGATLQACAASGLFTQDVEDHTLPTSPAGPDAWFKANGWDGGDAEEKAHHDSLTAKLGALPDNAKAAFKEWRREQGIDLSRALTRDQWEAASAKASELGPFDPFAGDDAVGSSDRVMPYDEPAKAKVEGPEGAGEGPRDP
jgi:hypothetical protein